ncbi:RNA polymerase sigma factor [Nocardia salmonicida]|uniref:RNA polymerase sigma factor n=1 Tax=Nocardia salmonicida TaxID=53431 RepID=UPI0033EBAAFD
MTDADRDGPLGQKRFDELYMRYSPPVFRRALQAFRGDKDRANELVQQVFIEVWQQFDRKFRDEPEHRNAQLISTITRRRVVDAHRRRHRLVPVEDHAESCLPIFSPPPGFADPLQRVLGDADLEQLRQTLATKLTKAEYEVAMMAWSLGIPDREIAEILACTVSTVQSHKSRARKKIEVIISIAPDAADGFSVDQSNTRDPSRTGRGSRASTRTGGETSA